MAYNGELWWLTGNAFATTGTGSAREYTITNLIKEVGLVYTMSISKQGVSIPMTTLKDQNAFTLPGKPTVTSNIAMWYDLEDADTKQIEMDQGVIGNLIWRFKPGVDNYLWVAPVSISTFEVTAVLDSGLNINMTVEAAGDMIRQQEDATFPPA